MTSVMEKFVGKFKKDGVDHVRVNVIADTAIGRMASAEWRKRFYVPRVGDFLSPICFANWLATGDEEARHDPKYRVKKSVRGYHQYVLYAKFFQLCSMRSALVKEMKHLPFAAYKIHQSGIKEFDRWKEYPSVVKDMIEHVIDPERGPKVAFNWENSPEEEINKLIAAIAASNSDPEDSDEEKERQESNQVAEENDEEEAEALTHPVVDESQQPETASV